MSGDPPNPDTSPVQIDPRHVSVESDDLTAHDWVLCALCSGIACIIGIIRMIQGKPSGSEMVMISIGFIVLWTAVNIGLSLVIQELP